jgi:hypothetical protein
MIEEQYIKDLEDTISKFSKPIKDIPFNVIIKALLGYSIISFNKDDVKDIELLEKLTIAIGKATKKADTTGSCSKSERPNEK